MDDKGNDFFKTMGLWAWARLGGHGAESLARTGRMTAGARRGLMKSRGHINRAARRTTGAPGASGAGAQR